MKTFNSDADRLLFQVIRMMDFSEHRKYCCAQEEQLFQEIEYYLDSIGVTDYRLNSRKSENKKIQKLDNNLTF